MLEEEADEEGASLTRVSSCDLGVDRPEEEVDLESIFNSVSVAPPGMGISNCEDGSGRRGGWEGTLSSISSHESTALSWDCFLTF